MREVRPRIVGTEMEWAISCQTAGSGDYMPLEYNDAGRMLGKYFPPDLRRAGSMFSNGSRIYVDIGSHTEYATPEDISFEGTLVNELAGERLITGALTRLMLGEQHIDRAFISKRVIASDATTWGYHVNLSANAEAVGSFGDDTMHLMALHLLTSQAMLGGGAIYHEYDGTYQYSLGQKVLGLTMDYSSGTTSDTKPLINQRNEPHARAGYLARVHITSTDPHVSPWATKMMLGTSSLVLRMIEQQRGKELRLRLASRQSLTSLARGVAVGTDNGKKFELTNGRTITPLELQYELASVAEATEHTDEEHGILGNWQVAIGDLEHDVMLLADRSDAIAKLALMKAVAARRGIEGNIFADEAIRALDIEYNKIAKLERQVSRGGQPRIVRQTALAQTFRHGMFRRNMPESTAVRTAITHPPRTTRASVRGSLIDAGATNASWTSATVSGREIELLDPYENKRDLPSRERVDLSR